MSFAAKRKRDDAGDDSGAVVVHTTAANGGGQLITAAAAAAASRAAQVQVEGVQRTSSLHAPIMQLEGHQGIVYACRFAPSGDVLATASFDKTICLWRVFGETCENFSVLKGHKNAVLDLACLAAATSHLASVGADAALCLWDVETGARVRRVIEHRAVVNAVAASGDVVATVSDDCAAKIWDSRSRSAAFAVPHRFPLTAVAFGGNSHALLTGGVDGIVRMIDLRKDSSVVFELVGHDDLVCGLAVNPLGTHLISNSFDCTLREWDIRPYCASSSRQTLTYMGHGASTDKNLLRCAWSPDGQRVTAGSGDRFVYVWDRATQKILYKLPGHRGCVNDVQFSPVESECIVASASNDRTIFLGELQRD